MFEGRITLDNPRQLPFTEMPCLALRDARADDKEMTGSLNAALQGFAAIERKHRMVDNLEKYQRVNEEFSFPKNRKQDLPLDEARQSPRPPRQLC